MVQKIKMKRVSFGVIGSLVLFTYIFTGCGKENASTTIDISGTTLTGVKKVDLHLGEKDDHLEMDGEITMQAGSAQIEIKTIGTDEVLYSEAYTSKNSGKISINIDNLDSNTDLVLCLISRDAKEINLHLESDQKLGDKVEKPERPKKE